MGRDLRGRADLMPGTMPRRLHAEGALQIGATESVLHRLY